MSRVNPALASNGSRAAIRAARGATNVRVVCRFRPQNSREKAEGGFPIMEVDEPTDSGQDVRINGAEGSHKFTFDRVFGVETTQIQVYEHAAKPIVESVLEGFNGTVFAYGQTGSGKTFTMEGPNIDDPQMMGIIPRMVTHVFDMMMNASANVEFTVSVSLIEIYLEKIRDLLDESKTNLSVHEDKIRGVYVEDATQEYVSSPEDVYAIMKYGASLRATASTSMNNQSSRSHSVFMMEIKQRDTKTEGVKVGRLSLVDLAGSEKVRKTNAQGDRLEEAKNINKSLSALGNVINALTDNRASHIPYRDSKLTRILQQSLGGNAKTCLVLAASPSSWNEAETISTLRFGARAKLIKNNAHINQEFSAAQLRIMLAEAEAEIERLKELLGSGGALNPDGTPQSEEDKWNAIQLQDALLAQLRDKTEEARRAREEADDLRRGHEEELQILKEQLEELREQLNEKKLRVVTLEDQVKRQQDELLDKENMIEMLTGSRGMEEDANAPGKDERISELEALVELQRKELRELEELHSGIDGIQKSSLTDLLASKEVENEKFKARVKEQEARSARLLTSIRQHQERERQFKTIVKQLNDAHVKLREDFKTTLQAAVSNHAAALQEVKLERDQLRQSNSTLHFEVDELRKANLKLNADIKDRFEELIQKELDLEHEVGNSDGSLKGTVDQLQRNLEQYSALCQQLLADNNALSHRHASLEQRCAALQVGAERFERLREVITGTEVLKQAVIGQGISGDELQALPHVLDAPFSTPASPESHGKARKFSGGPSMEADLAHRDRPRFAKPIRGGSVLEGRAGGGGMEAFAIAPHAGAPAPIKVHNVVAPVSSPVEIKIAKRSAQ